MSERNSIGLFRVVVVLYVIEISVSVRITKICFLCELLPESNCSHDTDVFNRYRFYIVMTAPHATESFRFHAKNDFSRFDDTFDPIRQNPSSRSRDRKYILLARNRRHECFELGPFSDYESI